MKLQNYFLSTLLIVITTLSCKIPAINNQASISERDIRRSGNWTLFGFVKADEANPIMKASDSKFPDPILRKEVLWDSKDVFNPAVVVRAGKVFMLFRAEDSIGKYAGTSRIGLAESTDGIHFTRHASPVLYPDNDAEKKYEWEGGCEDPRVVEDVNGKYIMTYTAYDGDKARLMVAVSKDLVHWQKHGHAFSNAASDKYEKNWSKSGSIVSRYLPDGKIVAAKINGKYWMYWGDTFLWTATSDDLINWTPVKMSPATDAATTDNLSSMYPELKIVLAPRKGKFDSDLVEPGPPAMLTDKGILLIYNSRNVPAKGDSTLKEGTYAASQALFDKNDPTKLIKRMDSYFMKPDRPYEIAGQVNEVCFLEGLARFKNKWFLYYGTADSKIAVAVSDAGMK